MASEALLERPEGFSDGNWDDYQTQWRNYLGYSEQFYTGAWQDVPSLVSIETLMKCNASCEFCPYPTSDRQGEVLETSLVLKVIGEVADACSHLPLQFSFCRVNEPFLDKRIFDFFEEVRNKLPLAQINHFTNATPLTDRVVDRILDIGNTGYLRVSLNESNADDYRRVMGLDFERTLAKVRRLHDRKLAGEIAFPVYLGRVGDGSDRDVEYADWVEREFPAFITNITPRFDWMGRTHAIRLATPDIRCTQWFQLNILANGKEAFCCIDDSGRFGRGDVRFETAIEIYNHPTRRAIRLAKSRRDVQTCASCNAWL